jgi:hypothetical protein
MHPGSHADLLAIWERGLERSPPRRALDLLAWGWMDEPAERLAALPVGAREGRLAELRAALFGPLLVLSARCPACDAQVELSLPLAELRAAPPPAELRIETDGFTLVARPPTAADLADAAACASLERAVTLLRERVLVAAERGGEPVAATELSAAALVALDDALEAADPLGDPRVAVTCLSCAQGWTAPLDLAAVLWDELDAWARRTLRDVHSLARAYGWSEAAILALSARRRYVYLSLIDA